MREPPPAQVESAGQSIVRPLLLIATLLALVVTLAASVRAEQQFARSAEWVEHTMLVKSTLSELTATLDEAESSERGYILTGRPEYLEPYRAAAVLAPLQLERLRSLLDDSAQQELLLGDVSALVSVRLDELRRAVQVRDRAGEAEAVAIVQTNVGLRTMDSLTDRVSAMVTAEESLLAARRASQRRNGALLVALLVASSVALGLFLTMGLGWARTADARRRSAEANAARLRAENEALSERKRTAEFQERFIAILGHDLRNPLSSMTMGLRVLRMSPPEKQPDTIARLERSASRMTRMIEQLIDLARSRLGGGIAVKPEATDLGRIVSEVTDEARAAHPGRAIAIETDGDLQGNWDADRLAQVVSNLVENAVRHGSEDAPVSIRVHGNDGGVALAVHNRGPAIPGDLARMLFDPFRRGERESKTTRTSGLGLGLYIARQIVAAHGGTIELASTEGEGTTFTIELPRAQGAGTQERTHP